MLNVKNWFQPVLFYLTGFPYVFSSFLLEIKGIAFGIIVL